MQRDAEDEVLAPGNDVGHEDQPARPAGMLLFRTAWKNALESMAAQAARPWRDIFCPIRDRLPTDTAEMSVHWHW